MEVMAKRRPMGRYIRGGIDEDIPLTTLAARTLTSAVFDDSVTERSLISSMVATWTMKNKTAGASIGPIMVGVAHSDYTNAEIQEVIDNTRSWEEQDKIGQEVGRRLVRIVGTFSDEGGAAPTVSLALKDGQPIKVKLNWILNAGQSLRAWAYNLGSAAIATTVPVVHLEGHANLWPR